MSRDGPDEAPEPAAARQELFLELRALDPTARGERLRVLAQADEAGARDLATLLRADRASDGFLETPALGVALAWSDWSALAESTAETALPAGIGRYTIESVLGRGGMGVVYRATQGSPHRTVALKVLEGASRERLRRFEHEGELLARLRHPGIAQVFETGSVLAGGRTLAFLAMELVPGEELRAHLGRAVPDLRARLALFTRIAEAVAHAHQKGVVHRDLKPENILVSPDGLPHVVDFGVARLIGGEPGLSTLHTEAGRLVGTPWYMSPEQLAGDPDAADTRSDVYALGVIGYELFSGALPYALEEKPLAEVARLIRDAAPARIRALERALPDLATVLGKCLEKEPARRYGSASELAGDLVRVQRSEPISARAPSGLYLLQRFVRRNRALTLALAAGLLVLGLGVAGFVLQARRVAGQRDRAVLAEALAGERLLAMQRERDKFEHGFDFLQDLLRSADPNADGKDVRVADLLARGGAELDGRFPEAPEVEAALRRALGGSLRALGRNEEALRELRRALELLGRLPDEPAETDLARNDVALLLTELERFDEARPLYRDTLARQAAALGPAAQATLVTQSNLAALERRRGALDEAETLFRAVLAAEAEVPEGDEAARLFAAARRGLAALLEERGERDEARALLDAARAALEARFDGRDTDVLATLSNLGALEASLGELPLAIEHLASCLAGYAAVLPAGHPSLLTLENNLGTLLARAGRFAEGEPLLVAALAGRRALFGAESTATLTTASNLGGAWLDLGRLAEAEALLRTTHETLRRVVPERHWMPWATGVRLAECWSRQGRPEEALALAEESLRALEAALGARAEKTRSAARLLARLEEARGGTVRAAELRTHYALEQE